MNRALCKRAAGHHLTVFDRQLDPGKGNPGTIGFTPGAPANGGRRRGLGGPHGVQRPPQFSAPGSILMGWKPRLPMHNGTATKAARPHPEVSRRVGTKEIWVPLDQVPGVPGSATAGATKALTNTKMPPMWSRQTPSPRVTRAKAAVDQWAICTIASHRNVLTFGSPVVPLVHKCTKA